MTKVNDEILQEMIRSCSNAEDVQEFVSRTGLELSSPELRAVMAVVDFRAAGLPKEASASRRAAFLGRVALQGTRRAEARRPWNPWIRRMALAAVAVAALGVAAAGASNVGGVTDRAAEAVGLREGKYHTRSFEPAFSVTLPAGWEVALDKRDAFIPRAPQLPEFTNSSVEITNRAEPLPEFVLGIFKPLAWADPANEDREVHPPDIIAWLQAHPYLDAGRPWTVTVGGITATQIHAVCTYGLPEDFGIDDNTLIHPDTGVPIDPVTGAPVIDPVAWGSLAESVTLFYLENPYTFFGVDWEGRKVSKGGVSGGKDTLQGGGFEKLHVSIAPGVRYRFIVLEVAGADLVVVAPVLPPHFGPSTYEVFAQGMIRSLTFK